MYRKGDNTISSEVAAQNAAIAGISIEEWASTYCWSFDEGKQNDSTETDPPANQKTETSVGESNSGDISLGSPVVDSDDSYMGMGAAYGNVLPDLPVIAQPKKDRQELNSQEYDNYTTSKLGVLDRANPSDNTNIADPNIYNIKTTGVKGATAEDIYNVGWYGGTTTSTAEDVSMETLENPVDLSPQLSNAEYNPDGTTNFVDISIRIRV